MLKRILPLLLFVLLLSVSATAQVQDQRIVLVGNSAIINNGTSLTWNAMNNRVWLFRVPASTGTVTMTITHLGANPVTFTTEIFFTGNNFVSNFSNNQPQWQQRTWDFSATGAVGSCATASGLSAAVPRNICWRNLDGAMQVAIRFKDIVATDPDAPAIFVSWNPSQTPLYATGDPVTGQATSGNTLITTSLLGVAGAVADGLANAQVKSSFDIDGNNATPIVANYIFDAPAATWNRMRSSITSLSGAAANFYLAAVPHLHDGNNADPMESAFLIQQQGNGAQTSNSGDGIVPMLGFNDNLETYNLLGSGIRSGLKVASPFEYNADVHTLTYNANRQADAPTAGDFLNVNAGASNTLLFESLLITSEVAAQQLDIFITNAAGVTCTAITPGNTNAAGGAANGVANHTCTTDPVTASTVARINLAAGIPFFYNLQGYRAGSGTGDGISVNLVTTPGAGNNISVTLTWRECASSTIC